MIGRTLPACWSAMAFIDATALNVVLPSLQKNLQASAPELFWILNAYLLMLAALILIGVARCSTMCGASGGAP